MPASLEIPPSRPDPGQGDSGFTSTPLLLLVFGFVLLVLLQAWFVRRVTQLSARYKERQATSRRLSLEAAELAEAVSGLDRARESNTASLAALEREILELEKRIETFIAENPLADHLKALEVVTAVPPPDEGPAEARSATTPQSHEDA